MRLNDRLVTEIDFQGKVYPLDLAFDNVLDVFDIINSDEMNEYEKLDLILEFLVGREDQKEYADFNELDFENQLELYQTIMDTHISNTEEQFIELDVLGNPMPKIDEEKIIDLEADAKFIYASFLMIGINLFEEQGKMQWVEFQAILQALPDDCIMSKIIQIRQWEPKKGESTDYREEMRRLQDKYRLGGEENG